MPGPQEQPQNAQPAAPQEQPQNAQPAAPQSEGKGKTEPQKPVPTLFTASISASYSRKFSLDTTVHSEITVTMKPYPPPDAFLNAVRAHYEKEQEVEKKKQESQQPSPKAAG